MNRDQYAPVLIPTLNRFAHFKRCLESLERCTGAEYTDVFVGLDYPPSKKYVAGWEKINSYLKDKEINNNFRNLFVRRRDHNCGVKGLKSNYALLFFEIENNEEYNSYIISEDDNEFSPNFLEYMNKALDKYRDDPRILRICGYTPSVFQDISDENIFCNIDSPAYGMGNWLRRNYNNKLINYKCINTILKESFWKTVKLFFSYPALIYMAIHMIKRRTTYGDVRYSMHNLTQGTFSICPTKSLVRNWGADGSGLRSGIVKGLEKEEIQAESNFILDNIDIKLPHNFYKALFRRNMPKNNIKFSIYLIHKFFYTIWYFFFFHLKEDNPIS